jgi:type IV pilus assembly protein PilC
MRFAYRALTEDGRTVRGQIEAENESELERELAANRLTLLEAREIRARRRARAPLQPRDIIDFYFQMESMLRAGVPLLDFLADLRDTSASPAIQNLAEDLHRRIEAGASLSQALAAHPKVAGPMICSLIKTAEATGQLPDVLAQIVASLKWRDELKAQTKKALTYPAFVFVVITAVVIFLMTYLVPQLITFLENMGQTLPFATRALIAVSRFITESWYLFLIVPTGATLLIAFVAKHNVRVRQWLHRQALQIPLVGAIIQKIILARFADVFALMYRSGVPILDALQLGEEVTQNLEVRTAIEHARRLVTHGVPISQAFAGSGLFPPLVIRMLRVGEQTGALDDALANVSYYYARDVNESVARLQTLIEPILTVVLGLILGWIMFAVLGPVYDTITKIRM